MRTSISLGTIFFLLTSIPDASGAADGRPETVVPLDLDRATRSGEDTGPISATRTRESSRVNGGWALSRDCRQVAKSHPDTLSFGSIDEDGFAILGARWTWDHGGGDPLEGWSATDVTLDPGIYFRPITDAIWTGGTGNAVEAPILSGVGSLWVGAFENEADDLCWEAGLGYGNSWCQRARSPVLEYTGAGTVQLEFTYFNDTELNFDYTKVLLRRLPSEEEVSLNSVGFTDQIGLAPTHPADPPIGARYTDVILSTDFEGETGFQIVFEMTSDAEWSDEDGRFVTEYGPFAADDVVLAGSLSGGDVGYAFEGSLEGWAVEACPGLGTFMGVRDVSSYVIEDACGCELSNKVLELHDDNFEHPEEQHVYARSNPVDVSNDVTPFLGGTGEWIVPIAEWDQYADLIRDHGVFYRPGWEYYPYVCPETGAVQWSGRVGQDNYYYVPLEPVCASQRSVAPIGIIPGSGIEQIRFVYELYATCGLVFFECWYESNFTPVIDNMRIRFTRAHAAPSISFSSGTRYQDGFAQGDELDPNGIGRADVTISTNYGNVPPFVLGDSLYVRGPTPTSSTRWESRLWFRIGKEGPGAKPTAYNSWKAAIADGKNITGGEFTFAWMDSFQQGTQTQRNKFVSFLREAGEDDYNFGGGEFGEANEIIRDDVLVAGTRIEYFVSSNYTATPMQNFTLPDTSGQFFSEFEILPGWVDDDGTLKFPCLLYVDASNGEARPAIESGLQSLGLRYDRYDYLDADSRWKAPLARGEIGSNNGAPLLQLLGYRAIIVGTGALTGSGSYYKDLMWPEDFVLLGDWLTALACDGDLHRRGLILNGDGLATALASAGSGFLVTLGAVPLADAYHEFGVPPDQNHCVRLDPVPGSVYGTENSSGDYAYDAYGNWCPQHYAFDVLGTSGTGVGNRAYVNVSNLEETHYAQVANQVEAAGTGNYRTVIDGVSYHHLSERDATLECAADSTHIVRAVSNEMSAALEWIFDGTNPTLCENPCTGPVHVPDLPVLEGTRVTRLYPNSPNPFSPRTVLRFSIAHPSDVELAIFDVNGRRVRTLVADRREPGLYEVVWDCTDESSHRVGAGVFWSQLTTEDYASSKKMIVVK